MGASFRGKLVEASREAPREYVILRNGERDLSFVGWEIACARTGTYRWGIYQIFLTQEHRVILRKEHGSDRVGESTHSECMVAEAPYADDAALKAEIIKFFGLCDLAKQLYRAVSIDVAVKIE